MFSHMGQTIIYITNPQLMIWIYGGRQGPDLHDLSTAHVAEWGP